MSLLVTRKIDLHSTETIYLKKGHLFNFLEELTHLFIKQILVLSHERQISPLILPNLMFLQRMVNDMLVHFNHVQCFLKIISVSMVYSGSLKEVSLVWQLEWPSFRACENKFFGSKVIVFRSMTDISAIKKLGVTVTVGIFVHIFVVAFLSSQHQYAC